MPSISGSTRRSVASGWGFLLGQVIQQHLGFFQVGKLRFHLRRGDDPAAPADQGKALKGGREQQSQAGPPIRQVGIGQERRLVGQDGIPGEDHFFRR